MEIRLFETTLAQQVKGLSSGLYNAGFAHAAAVGEGLISERVWTDPLVDRRSRPPSVTGA